MPQTDSRPAPGIARGVAMLFCALAVAGVCARAAADMMADSPVKFPESGPLPAKFPTDESAKDYHAPEQDYAIHSSPERSLAQIEKIQTEMPKGEFTPPPTDWAHLPRTKRSEERRVG